MKITAIRPYPAWVGIRNQLLVKVETDEGVFGWGESGLSGRERAVAGAIEHYREFLIGRDPFRTGAIWQEMYRSQYFEGGRVLQAAISAIDIALHDIKGKALGVPGAPAARRQAARSHPDLRHHFRAAPGPAMIDAGQSADECGLDRDAPDAVRPRSPEPLRAARAYRRHGEMVREGARGAGRRGRARRRLSPSPVGRRSRELLPEDAVGHARLPRRADPRRNARGLSSVARDGRYTLRDRRRIRQQMAISALYRSAISISSTGSTSATSAV